MGVSRCPPETLRLRGITAELDQDKILIHYDSHIKPKLPSKAPEHAYQHKKTSGDTGWP